MTTHRQARKSLAKYNPRTMSDDTYAMKRQAMKYVYEAKALLGDKFKRINVIVGEATDEAYVGLALTGKQSILIPADTFKRSEQVIKFVVWHEICHALGHRGHDESCPLMCSRLPRKMDWAAIEKAFIAHCK